MNWSKDISTNELIFIAIFLLLYAIYFIRLRLIAKKLKTTYRSSAFKFFLRSIYFSLMIFALLGPSFGITDQEARNTSKDIYLCLDLSKSMDSDDVLPSRLEKVKFEFSNFIDQEKSNKIGFMIFSEEAYIHTPLTYDFEVLKQLLKNINTNLLPDSGTNINSILELIIDKFKYNPVLNRQQVAIIITDGEDFGEFDESLLGTLKKSGVQVYFVGIGTANGGKIPYQNAYKKDSEGNEIVSSLNINFLRNLSRNQGKSLYTINNNTNDINKLILSINQMDNKMIDSRILFVTNNKYQYFLFLIVFLICIDFLFSVKVISI